MGRALRTVPAPPTGGARPRATGGRDAPAAVRRHQRPRTDPHDRAAPSRSVSKDDDAKPAHHRRAARARATVTDGGRSILLAEMTSAQVRAQLGRGRSTVIVPFGAVEQHGPHLPLDTDAVLADRLGPLLADRLGGLCAPTMRLGCSEHHLAFAG